jgi:putative oxidoreductase
MAGYLDRLALSSGGIILLLGRLAMAAIFVPSGFGKLSRLDGFAQSLASKGLPASGLLAVIAAGVEFFGAICIVLGLKTRYFALLMALFTAIAALISHDFWNFQDAARTTQYIQFMKNLAIIGGFMILFAVGPGPWSIDRRGR